MIYLKGFIKSIKGGYFDIWLFETISFIKFDYYVKFDKQMDYIRIEKRLSRVSRQYWRTRNA